MKTTFAIVIIVLAGPAALSAADEPPGQGSESALDRELLDGLDRELLEGLPQPARLPPKDKRPAGDKAANDLPAGEDLGAAAASQNPLANIAAQMRAVESQIAAGNTSPEIQAEQKRILAELAALLEQAKRQGSGGQPKPGKGSGQGSAQAGQGSGDPTPGAVTDSTDRIERGSKDAAEPADVKDLLSRIWGHLPDKVRDQMQASLSEQFLPKYERLIEEYYQRLAEERPGEP